MWDDDPGGAHENVFGVAAYIVLNEIYSNEFIFMFVGACSRPQTPVDQRNPKL